MQVVVETLDNLVRKMKITVPAEQVEQEIARREKQVMRTAKIDGFRPGKIPESVVRQQFGKDIESESLNKVLQHSLPEAFTQEKLTPAGRPYVDYEHYERGQPFTYVATFEVFPDIIVKPFSDLIIEKAVAPLDDATITQTLEGMRNQHTKWHEVTRASETGDRVWINFVGTVDDKEFSGGKAENMSVILGSHQTIPGFEEGLTQHTAGESFDLSLIFPENYGAKDLAGKPVKFEITLNKVEAPELPVLNDEFAKQFGIAEGGIEKLKEEIKSTLDNQRTQALREQLKQEVMQKLSEAYAEVVVPQILIQQEAETLRQQMEKQLSEMQKQGGQLPTLKTEMFLERAKHRVLLGLVLAEIIDHFQLKADPIKVRTLIEETAARFDEPEQIIEWHYRDKKRLAQMESLALEEQIVDKIVAEATVVEKVTALTELLQQGGAR